MNNLREVIRSNPYEPCLITIKADSEYPELIRDITVPAVRYEDGFYVHTFLIECAINRELEGDVPEYRYFTEDEVLGVVE